MRFSEVGSAHDSFLLRFEMLMKKSKVLTDHLHRVDMHFYLTGLRAVEKQAFRHFLPRGS